MARLTGLLPALGMVAVLVACDSSHHAASACRSLEPSRLGGEARVAICIGGREIAIPSQSVYIRRARRRCENARTCSTDQNISCNGVPAVRLQNQTSATVLISGVRKVDARFNYGLFQTDAKLRRLGDRWRLPAGRYLPAGHYPTGVASINALWHSPSLGVDSYWFCIARSKLPSSYTARQIGALLRQLKIPHTSQRHRGLNIFSMTAPAIPRIHNSAGRVQVIVGKSASHCCAGLSLPVGNGFHMRHVRNVWIYYRGSEANLVADAVMSYLR